MAATSAQIESSLKLTSTFSLITGASVITDATDWGSIGVATPDTAKILLQIYDSSGGLVYENAGWDAGDYSSPDLSLLDTTYSFTLPTDIAGDYIQGQYTINTKVQVVEDGEITVVLKTFYQNVSATCNNITLNVQGSVVAGTTLVNLTDFTQYGTYSALSRTMILYPPPPSGQASETGTNVDVLSYGGTTYTGIWTWKITSDVTFTDVDGVSTTCRLTGQGTFNVEQSQLCKVLCLLEKYRNAFWVAKANKNSETLESIYNLAMIEYQFACQAVVCGKSQTVIDGHLQKIYSITGIDPDCDCGCDNGISQPLLSAPGVGPQGPAGATGAAGAAGATGAAGASGSAVLYNDISSSATTTTGSIQPLKAFSLPANTLSTNGDIIHIHAVFKSQVANVGQVPSVSFNGLTLAGWFFVGSLGRCVMDISISRLSNTSISFENNIKPINGTTAVTNPQINIPLTVGGLNLTTTAYTILARGFSIAVGDIVCEELQVINYRYGTPSTISNPSLTWEYLLTSATSYVFDGTVTAYNSGGISLIGKTLLDYTSDGISRTIIGGDYTFNNTTGTITIPTTAVGAAAKITYQ